MTKNGRKSLKNTLFQSSFKWPKNRIYGKILFPPFFFSQFIKFIKEKCIYYHFIPFKHVQNEPKIIVFTII